MHVVIAKVDQVFFDGEAASLTVPGAEGEMTILGEHMPLITTLKRGTITVRSENIPGGEQFFPIETGIIEVRRDGTTVIL
jgi:F-type H+-transporting ATPase subunit epsilon